MNRKISIPSALFALVVGAVGPAVQPANAAADPTRAVSYINPDLGLATANPNVSPISGCAAPDQEDTQQLSDASNNRNVHNDACTFDSEGRAVSAAITYSSSGIGVIAACPDPDADGPELAFVHDHDGDGGSDHCHQSAYQSKGTVGDAEYHVRLNNAIGAGNQAVAFCVDPDQDASAGPNAQPAGHGCADAPASLVDRILIHWTEDAVTPADASSYVNRDAGTPTENGDVDPNSDCTTPDQRDRQRLSNDGTVNRNVHNDACLIDTSGDEFNTAATYESTGVGYVSACPDPDGAGPGVAFTHDHDGNSFIEHCHQSGFQAKGAVGDGEYHARLNNTSRAGEQRVRFCADPDQDVASAARAQPAGHGCGEAPTEVLDRIVIRWYAAPPICQQDANAIVGTPAGDVLRGTPASDVFCGLGGDDQIVGGGGDDLIIGGPGRDELIGGPGADRIYGGAGADEAAAGDGDDRVFGGFGGDVAYGSDGADEVTGGAGRDTLSTGAGADRLFGNSGADALFAGIGDDLIAGGTRDDFLSGQAGDDSLFGRAGDDMLRGGIGVDFCRGGRGDDSFDGC